MMFVMAWYIVYDALGLREGRSKQPSCNDISIIILVRSFANSSSKYLNCSVHISFELEAELEQ